MFFRLVFLFCLLVTIYNLKCRNLTEKHESQYDENTCDLMTTIYMHSHHLDFYPIIYINKNINIKLALEMEFPLNKELL